MNFKNFTISIIVLLITSITLAQNSTRKYFRHLRYNHVSPYIKLTGTYPLDVNTAKETSHYIFTYNDRNDLVEITNNHYFTERSHPLTSIGAYKTVITHTKDIETRIFFNKNGKRITNDRKVYKEVFTKGRNLNYTKLEFFDIVDKPMESNWEISKYVWFKHKKMIVEKRFNLKNEPKNLSTYFEFGITGMTFRKDGTPIANYNLSKDYKIINNTAGVASYQDTYDTYGNHIKYTYHDKDNKLVLNQIGLAIGTKEYDAIGNYIKQAHYDQDMKFIRGRNISNNQNVALSKKASQKDSVEIKRISLGYLIALQDLKPKLMKEVMNDSLNKVSVGYSRTLKKEVTNAISKKRMIENAENWNKSNTKFPPNPKNEIKILDIYHRIATVKLYSDNWVEYLHLIKLDGKWSIINLLWQHKNVNRYPF
ncbi:nuclear transport factor 2 family protein [Polaribacter litorisediminis]|uniref:nuclear transport factor 2 family protein n=1 Tax=Polaribacter litorisediminis TaxID=1908341 RepID=UPI001CBABE3D|nr:nuclear transport factor 2 family protein [Polaribacter litorisediminis]UAM98870.1 nuclear transport factor 2 family protein [Polaribacter litorisediminis]